MGALKPACVGAILVTLSLAQPTPLTGNAAISGTVTNTVGEPLRKVSLQLLPVAVASAGAPALGLSAETDSQGNFTFDQVPPGRYALTAQRTGYLNASYADNRGGVLKLEPGQKVTSIAIKMTPQGIIAGRVVDEDNEPLSGETVNVRPTVVPAQLARTMISAGIGTTNADGAFAIGGLPPGRYILSVDAPSVTIVSPPSQSRPEVYVPTYYPESVDPDNATPIELAPGGQVRGLEIRLHKVPVYRVSGKATNTTTREPASAVLTLFRRGGVPGISAKSTGVSEGGEFVFDGIAPGSYILEAKSVGDGEDRASLVSWQTLSGRGVDLDRVAVELRPGIELRGSVVLDGSPTAWPQISFTPIEGLNYPGDFAKVDANGRFSISGLEPAPYRVTIAPMPPPMFVKEVRFNGREITDQIVDLGSSSADLEIVVSDRSSSVSGVVTDSTGPAGPGVMVMAASKTQGQTRVLTTGDAGQFSFPRLAPGEYVLVALDVGRFVQFPPEVLRKVGKAVTLVEGVPATLDLQLTTTDQLRLELR